MRERRDREGKRVKGESLRVSESLDLEGQVVKNSGLQGLRATLRREKREAAREAKERSVCNIL